MRRLNPALPVIALVVLAILSPTAVSAERDEPAEGDRRVEIKPIKFVVDVPSHWQLKINERQKQFLSAQETDEKGNLRPASVNIQYHKPRNAPFPQATDPEAYVKLIGPIMSKSMADFKVIDAQAIELSGYKGVRVEFTMSTKGIPLRMNHYRIVHPDGEHAFIITCGTVTKLWNDIEKQMLGIVDSIQLGDKE